MLTASNWMLLRLAHPVPFCRLFLLLICSLIGGKQSRKMNAGLRQSQLKPKRRQKQAAVVVGRKNEILLSLWQRKRRRYVTSVHLLMM